MIAIEHLTQAEREKFRVWQEVLQGIIEYCGFRKVRLTLTLAPVSERVLTELFGEELDPEKWPFPYFRVETSLGNFGVFLIAEGLPVIDLKETGVTVQDLAHIIGTDDLAYPHLEFICMILPDDDEPLRALYWKLSGGETEAPLGPPRLRWIRS